ncbi:MAG: hypothetical protein LBH01_11775 [Verrucomicrobiales bacterium]|jgi:hypothetical protein|nr:hypothetical protein [Verrucomicrobiales bacterium]
MSDANHHQVLQAPKAENFRFHRLQLTPLALLITGMVFLAISVLWGFFNPTRFAYSWMFSFLFYFFISAGALFWLFIHHMTDADWSVGVRRLLENMAALFFPWLLLAAIPLFLLRSELFKWWDIAPGVDHVLDAKSGYLNHEFFIIRAVVFFLFFGLFSWKLRSLSLQQDANGDVNLSVRMRQWSYAGAVLFAIFITLVAQDWLIGVSYRWYSTILGVYVWAASLLMAMSALVMAVNGLRSVGLLREVTSVEHYHIMGKLMLAFTMFWSYVAFVQYMLYYYGNIPEETIFYQVRNANSWRIMSWALFIGGFILPFCCLLSRQNKRVPWRLTLIALWTLIIHAVEMYWFIMPAMQLRHVPGTGYPEDYQQYLHISPHPLDFTCMIGLGSFFAYVFLRNLRKQSLFPIRDPRLFESVNTKN